MNLINSNFPLFHTFLKSLELLVVGEQDLNFLLQVLWLFTELFRVVPHLNQDFGVLSGVENLVKDLFEVGLVTEWPKSLILMTENDVFHDGFANPH